MLTVRQPYPAATRPSAPLLLGAALLGMLPAAVLGLAWVAPGERIGALELLGLCVAPGLFLAALAEPRLGLALFILASGLAPELPGPIENLRLGDYVFLLLVIALLGRAAMCRARFEGGTPLALPVAVTTLVGIVSVFWGTLFLGRETDLLRSAAILMKRAEYLAIFLVVTHVVRSRRCAHRLLFVMLATAMLAGLHGFVTAGGDAHRGVESRIVGADGNYNTLAGFLVPHCCLAAALLFAARGWRARAALAAVLTGLVACLFFTYSREGYVMLAGALLLLGALRYRALLLLILFLAAAAPWIVPAPVLDRASDTWERIREYQTESVHMNSLTARISGWQETWTNEIACSPLLGVGVGNKRFAVDNEYLLRWAESGVIGLGAFLWLLGSIGALLVRSCRTARDAETKAVACASLAGFVALLIQGTVGPAFTTIRIMEPFHVLLGLVWVYSHAPAEEDGRDAAPSAVEGR